MKKSSPKKLEAKNFCAESILFRKALRSDRKKGTNFEANAPTKDWKENLVRVSL
jgi:hypothetical protein